MDEKMVKIMGSVDVPSAGCCATVEIVSSDAPGGFIVINLSDYDHETMTLYK